MKIKLKDVRISFAHGIFKAQKTQNGDEKFSATFLFKKDSDAHKLVEATIEQVGSEQFKKDWPSIKKQKAAKDKLVVHKGDDSKYEEYADQLYVLAYNKTRPDVRDRDASVLAESDGKIFSGCYVDAIIDIGAYESKTYGPQISVTLLGVQFRREGVKWGSSGVKADEHDFEPLTAGADADDL